MTFGIGVEGPSDKHFWDKVLHKHFRSHRFDVRNMKNRDKLIRETPRLLDQFRSLRYQAGFILVDKDDDPCVSSVVGLFDEQIRKMRESEKAGRFLHVCVAIRDLEAWYLADEEAINKVIREAAYQAPTDTRNLSKGKLRKLYKQTLGQNASFNEIDFAKKVGPAFSPSRAREHSASFRYFWETMSQSA